MFDIKTSQEFQQLLTSYDIVVVDVYANWCAPCKMTTPLFEDLYKSLQQSINLSFVFAKVNVETNLVRDVRALPTFLIFQQGNIIHQYEGAQGIDQINTFFRPQQPVKPVPKASEISKKKYKTFGSL